MKENLDETPQLEREPPKNEEDKCCGSDCGCHSEEPKVEKKLIPSFKETDIGIKVDQLIVWEEIKPRSLLVIKATREVCENMMISLKIIQSRYEKLLRDKEISVLLLGDTNCSLEVVNEETMNSIGWKRAGGLIITP